MSIILSLHDIVHFFESDLPIKIDLDNFVKMPNLIQLLYDYLQLATPHRTVLGKILTWELPKYKIPVDEKTGRMIPLNMDALYSAKILDIY